ncbi:MULTISPECIES: hypothetical protein [unclassified Nocardioides]|uniref:hypothetical protein n=1 Tax=unclassified Nocardioides TaxID=2615069 RepID=UPI0006FA2A6D|nr:MULTISPECIES: hypothetical protein [unclassified Nocardioides]KQY56685.1 hypothetical protein ASD30_10245 [Nocardioides sp. Root140]KQZ67118.1 hypothetical protein ASD66_19190 [Nocardioides sp. Root151]
MSEFKRSDFHQKVAETLINSGAIDLKQMTTVFQEFAEEAVLSREDLTLIINKNFLINCGWPGPELDLGQFQGRG